MKSAAIFVAGLAASAHALAIPKRSLRTRDYNATSGSDIDTTILQYALTLEHLEATFYAQALQKFSADDFKNAGYPDFVRQRINETATQEATHVTVLSTVLGANATQACTYDFGYNNVTDFLAVSRILEGVGVSAYLGAAPLISNKTYLASAGAILTVEARHEAEVDTFLGDDAAPSAFDTPLDFSQVYSLAAPFITSCPSTNPTLPVTQFPALTIETVCPQAGQTIQFNYTASANSTDYAHFLNGLQDLPVALNSQQQATVPSGLSGRVYVVIASSETLSDKATVAGPAIYAA